MKRITILAAVVTLLICLAPKAQAQTITTIAGNGTMGFSGDGGPATAAEMAAPNGICSDTAGNIYVADEINNCVRKISTTGIITTVVGIGSGGFSGDGGSATAAELNQPTGVAFDVTGDMYVADYMNVRIRKVDHATGIITTIAGNGTAALAGDGGPASAASFSGPCCLAIFRQLLYVSDIQDNRVRVINLSTGIITTVAGNGATTYAGDGMPATAAHIVFPQGICVDTFGDLYIADNGGSIRKVDHSTAIISTVAGTWTSAFYGDGGPATAAGVNGPDAVVVSKSGDIYLIDYQDNRIRKVDHITGIINTIAGDGSFAYGGDGGPASASKIRDSRGMCLDPQGNLFFGDQTSVVRKIELYVADTTDTTTHASHVGLLESTQQTVLIYPNPATNDVSISISSSFQPVVFNVINIMGQNVLTGSLASNGHFSVKDFPSGVYTIQILTREGTVLSSKLQKE